MMLMMTRMKKKKDNTQTVMIDDDDDADKSFQRTKRRRWRYHALEYSDCLLLSLQSWFSRKWLHPKWSLPKSFKAAFNEPWLRKKSPTPFHFMWFSGATSEFRNPNFHGSHEIRTPKFLVDWLVDFVGLDFLGGRVLGWLSRSHVAVGNPKKNLYKPFFATGILGGG